MNCNKPYSAPGADTISYEMLKQLPDSSKPSLLSLINLTWKKGQVPRNWKLAEIIPILKPRKDKLDPQSYRPISLTSAICKIMETMIAKKLTHHLKRNQCLSKNQSGFRPGRSTTDQLTRLESAIKMAFMENKIVVATFLDLEKASDLMWMTGTVLKLREFGITDNMLKWIHNFLTDRKIQVRVGVETSDALNLENGCPQGSVLSPILFNVIINTLQESLEKLTISLSQYADDAAVWRANTNINLALKQVQKVLNEIEARAIAWVFKVSTAKTKAILFSNCNLKLELFGNKIEFVHKILFLGMTFDRHLTWAPHILALKERCNRDLNLLKLVSGTSFGADKKTLLNLYKALIHILHKKYADFSEAYNSACDSLLKTLDSIQNSALRTATGALRSTPTNTLEIECGLKPT